VQLAPKAKIIVHEKGRPHLVNPGRLWQGSLQVIGALAKAYSEPEPAPEDRMISAEDGMKIDLGGLTLEVLLTPGHATHHLCFWEQAQGRLFAGESAGTVQEGLDVCLPSTPAPFDLQQSLQSLDRMISLHPRAIFYAHFGGFPQAVERLRECRQNLQIYHRIIAHNAEGNLPLILDEILESLEIKAAFYKTSPERLKMRLDFMRANIQGFLDYIRRAGPRLPA
jgi:glyoxylase-like metal-dependent hydrolase (beta-lactamase superfamily II)